MTVVRAIPYLHFYCVLPTPISQCALLPTPIWLRIVAAEGQLLHLGAVREHRPNLFRSGTARLKDDMSAIRGPGWEIVATAIVRKLHPLLAGEIHQVDIIGARRSRTVLPEPGKGQKLTVRSPGRGHRIALVRHALHICAVCLHGVNLRQPSASADKGDLR